MIKDMALIYWNRDMFEDALRLQRASVCAALSALACLPLRAHMYNRCSRITCDDI